jgi:hypothetical protein
MALDDAGDHAGQVGLRIEVVELGGLDEGNKNRPVLAFAVGAGEQGVLSVQRTGRMARSTVLSSISMLPSSRNSVRPAQWDRA